MTVAVSALPIAPGTASSGDHRPTALSWLLPKRVRPHLQAFHDVARLAVVIVDNPVLSPDEKLGRLFQLDTARLGEGEPFARRLVAAFKCDAVRNRTADWQDLLDYCSLSAVPIGRYLLALFGEDERSHEALDALCIALQMLLILQDMRLDRALRNRIYLPANWMREAGLGDEALDQPLTGPELRGVLDRMLDEIDLLLTKAERMPFIVRSLRLRMESAALVFIGRRLSRKLRQGDPLAEGTIRLAKRERLACAFCGTVRGLLRR